MLFQEGPQPEEKDVKNGLTKLFVGQIPKHLDEHAISPYFTKFGPIAEITVLRDHRTFKSRGDYNVGIVCFDLIWFVFWFSN